MLTVQKLNSELARKVECTRFPNLVKITNSKDYCILSEKFTQDYMHKIKNMQVYEDDVWVVTYPKCGTTWTQEMVKLSFWIIAIPQRFLLTGLVDWT
jgi:hypothetical protein